MSYKYQVTITELLKREVEIEADSMEEAESKVEKMYDNEEIVIMLEECVEVNMETSKIPSLIHVMVMEPGEKPKIVEIEDTLLEMRKLVGGYMEFHPLEMNGTLLIYNRDGKEKGLSPNRVLRGDDGEIADIIHGTFFICGESESGEHFTSLDENQLERYQRRFEYPEKIRMGMYGYTATAIKETKGKAMER